MVENQVDVSVILCAYNEEDVIENTISKVESVMRQIDQSYEIIVVDDGSLDNTKGKALEYRNSNHNENLKVISYKKNSGKGNAIKAGLRNASGKHVVLLDSDLDIDPKQIVPYLDALNDHDIAIGSKWHPKSRVHMSMKRKFLSVGFNVFSRFLTGIKMKDTQTGLKAFRKDVLSKVSQNLTVKRYAFDLQLMATCNHSGFRIAELPVDVRMAHSSSVGLIEIIRMGIDVVKIAHRLRFLKLYYHSSY